MRVLFYSAVAMAAVIATLTNAVRLEDSNQFAQLHAFEDKNLSGDAVAGKKPPTKDKKISLQIGDIKVTAGTDADPAELAKMLDTVKEKAAPAKPPVEDCECKNAVDAAAANGSKAIADAKGEHAAV